MKGWGLRRETPMSLNWKGSVEKLPQGLAGRGAGRIAAALPCCWSRQEPARLVHYAFLHGKSRAAQTWVRHFLRGKTYGGAKKLSNQDEYYLNAIFKKIRINAKKICDEQNVMLYTLAPSPTSLTRSAAPSLGRCRSARVQGKETSPRWACGFAFHRTERCRKPFQTICGYF